MGLRGLRRSMIAMGFMRGFKGEVGGLNCICGVLRLGSPTESAKRTKCCKDEENGERCNSFIK